MEPLPLHASFFGTEKYSEYYQWRNTNTKQATTTLIHNGVMLAKHASAIVAEKLVGVTQQCLVS